MGEEQCDHRDIAMLRRHVQCGASVGRCRVDIAILIQQIFSDFHLRFVDRVVQESPPVPFGRLNDSRVRIYFRAQSY